MKLTDPVTKIPTVGNAYLIRLKKLGIETLEDLINHVPTRYADFSKVVKIKALEEKTTVSVIGTIKSIKNEYARGRFVIQKAVLQDETGECDVVWFNQRFIPRILPKGTLIALSGKIERQGSKSVLTSPEYEVIKEGKEPIHTRRLVPVYPETKGISSKWLRSKIHLVFESADLMIKEFLADRLLTDYHLPQLEEAYKNVHFPNHLIEAELARKRLAINEFVFLHLKSLIRKNNWQKTKPTYKLKIAKGVVTEFIGCLPFKLTDSQATSVKEVLEDMGKNFPMNRLLEGDVGSGKTVVAAIAALVSFLNGKQTVVMAPTQILAEQHFTTLNDLFERLKVRISLVTSASKKIALGKTDIFIGTHALIHKKVIFDNVALVVIDEQHRFGVEQRAHLIKRSRKGTVSPHVLTMTATPIPRTVALTAYGDLDLSTLKELPTGRKIIKTWVIPETKRNGAYTWIGKQIDALRAQVFVICPLIEESATESMQQIKAATSEFENLKKVFKNQKIGLLHGRLKSKEKQTVVENFRSGKIDILVSTPVVEVGIDVPAATIMLIEAAERFGLASLHQLRGRVGRSNVQSYCLLFTKSAYNKRLGAMKKSMSGFELAEVDLAMRGPGEILGVKQHGFVDLKIAKWSDSFLIKLSHEIANRIYTDPAMFKKAAKFMRLGNIAMN